MSSFSDNSSICSSSSQKQREVETKLKKKKINAKTKNKIIINVSDCQYPVVSKVAKKFNWKLQNSSDSVDWDIFWTDNVVQPEFLLRMEPHQKVNHFPGMFNLSRKNLMGRNLMKMRKKYPEDYSFFPLTWMLPVQYHELKAYYDSKPKGKARTFIIKPEALSQGKGIYLTRRLEEIDQTSHCVVQRYLHRPYLIDDLKFDLRIYVLVASVDPLRLYMFNQGLTRFATEKYQQPSKDNMEDICMHLTNYAVNKENPNFVFNRSDKDMSKGHKRSITWLYEYLEKHQGENAKGLKQKIEQIIVKTMISGLPAISSQYRSCQPDNYQSNMCFELLGFDIILTDKCEPILLEINYTPSFSTDTPLDRHIKHNFIKDSLILMNINQKTKNKIIKERKQACQQRVITGKKMKLSLEKKEALREEAQIARDVYQSSHLGGFKKIYPIQHPQTMQKYSNYFTYSLDNYLASTGTKKVTIEKKTQKSQSAFGTCFHRKPLPTKTTKIKQTITTTSNLLKRKYEPKAANGSTSIMAYSQNMIKYALDLSVKENSLNTSKKIQQSQENLYGKKIGCARVVKEETQVGDFNSNPTNQTNSNNKADDQLNSKSYKTTNREEVKILTKENNLKSVEIFFEKPNDITPNQNRKNAFVHNIYTASRGRQTFDSDTRAKILKTCQGESRRSKLPSQFPCSNSKNQQKQKIPINLNTLLISGLQSHTQLSANNLKKILFNQGKL